MDVVAFNTEAIWFSGLLQMTSNVAPAPNAGIGVNGVAVFVEAKLQSAAMPLTLSAILAAEALIDDWSPDVGEERHSTLL